MDKWTIWTFFKEDIQEDNRYTNKMINITIQRKTNQNLHEKPYVERLLSKR
jgi:hypothetical protein